MKTLGIVALSALVISSCTVSVPAFADDGDDWRHHAACDHRVCLYVVDEEDDSDGDGVADIDELYLGTDVLDRLSMPAAQKLIDQVLMRDLPSFESHLTELVVLPQMTTDFSHLATAVGLMDLPSSAWGTSSLPNLFGDLAKNGLTGILSGWAITLPGSGHELPEGSDAAHYTYMQQVMDTTSGTSFNFPNISGWGSNNNKSGGVTTGGGASITRQEDGTYRMHAGQNTEYPDGSRDGTSLEGRTTKNGQSTTSTTLSSNRMGDTISKTVTESKTEKDPKTGKTTTETTTTTTTFNGKGQKTGEITTTTKVTTDPKTGTKTTEKSGSTTDANGTTTPAKPTKTVEACQKKDCSTGMVDPDYVSFSGPLTPDDYRKVMARLSSVRTPGPDTGVLTDGPIQIPTRDIYSNYTGDGVVVLSATPDPQFNSAHPEYNPELIEMAQLGGTVPPNPNADDPTGYWPDKP